MKTGRKEKYLFLAYACIVLAGFMAIQLSCFASTTRIPDEAIRQYRIAVSLEKRGNYYDAITEYKRFLFFLPDHEKTREVLYRTAKCYFKLRDWKNLLKYTNLFENKFTNEPLLIQVKILKAKALLGMGKPQEALDVLRKLQSHPQKLDENIRAEITALTGRCYVAEGNLEESRKFVNQDINEADLQLKNPWTAGISALLIPGMGHIYDGRPRDAWTAFFYTGILSAITWEAVENENMWLAGLFGTAAATFYSGNIFSAINMAFKHNRRNEIKWLNNYFYQDSRDVYIDYGSTPLYRSEEEKGAHEKAEAEKQKQMFSWMFLAGISAFRKIVSPIDNKHCPSYPSCSSYGLQAFRKYGAFWGTMLTIDRLIHEPSEARFSPYIIIRGERKIYDPLEANDFLLR